VPYFYRHFTVCNVLLDAIDFDCMDKKKIAFFKIAFVVCSEESK